MAEKWRFEELVACEEARPSTDQLDPTPFESKFATEGSDNYAEIKVARNSPYDQRPVTPERTVYSERIIVTDGKKGQ